VGEGWRANVFVLDVVASVCVMWTDLSACVVASMHGALLAYSRARAADVQHDEKVHARVFGCVTKISSTHSHCVLHTHTTMTPICVVRVVV
jgi:hypothetical protein